jgi:hypothetical protein
MAITEKDGKAEIEIIPLKKLIGQGCHQSQMEQPAWLEGSDKGVG